MKSQGGYIYCNNGIIPAWLQQLPKHFLILHSSNLHWQNSIELTARFVLIANLSLAEALFAKIADAKQIA
jgi:hypothetical protein